MLMFMTLDRLIKKNSNHRLITDPLKSNKKYDAIIVAVKHDHFKKYTSKVILVYLEMMK